jgi:AcrR family transcriptional regulator
MRGYHGVSVRDIAQHAKVPIALCGYYFGKKHELFMTLFEQNSAHIRERILSLRSDAVAPTNDEALERLVRVWVEPVVRMRANPESASFAILVARALWDPAEETQAAIEKYYDPVAFAFLDALRAIYPDRDPVDLTWGYEWAVGTLLMHIADSRVERISKKRAISGDVSMMERLIAFICAGLRSLPSGNEPRARAALQTKA